MNPATSLAPLQGKIVHRLELDDECSNVGVSSKKTSASKKVKRWKVCGFVFLPSECAGHSPELLLSLPHELRKLACQATKLKQTVRLTRYTYIHSIEARQAGIVPLLEVHSGGMQVNEASDRVLNQHRTTNPPISNTFTLRQFRQYEAVLGDEMKHDDKQKKEYDILATVDAISPIISMNPTFPFAFVELYDAQYPEETAVLLLKTREDIIYCYGISPGDTITMCKLRRKSWSAPNDLRQDTKRRFDFLQGRIPSLVFITVAGSRIDLVQPRPMSPIPATTIPLVSLEGKITQVETMTNRKKQKLIHWVTICGDVECDRPGVKLFLTYFPMDTALQLSVQVGAIIRAVNVHLLCDKGLVSVEYAIFGACLRSTVSIIAMASKSLCQRNYGFPGRVPYLRSESDSDPSPLPFQTQSHQSDMSDTRSICYPVPFHLKRIETTYHEYVYQQHIDEWLHDNFRHDLSSQLPALPSSIDLVDGARRHAHVLKGQAHRSAMRNPFAEFFDHGDERIEPNRSEETCSGCTLSRHDFPDNFRTVFVDLNKIKNACMESLMSSFDGSLRDGNMVGLPEVWSGSVHLQPHDILSSSNPSCMPSQLYTGGRVVETRSDGSTPSSISDRWCQLPVLMTKELNCTKGDFITLRIEKAVVSCLCLRSPKGSTLSKTNDMSKSLSPVKTVFFNDEYINGGCTVVRHYGYLLIVAVSLISRESLNLNSRQRDNFEESLQRYTKMETIDSLLADSLLFSHCKTGDYTNGIILRHRFAPKKINPMGYSQCCELTMCSVIDSEKLHLSGLSHLQSIDVKVSVPCPEIIRDRFREAFVCISGGVALADDECALGACWWTLADSGRTCALTSGGWNELQPNAPMHLQNQVGVRLRISLSAMHLGDRGYVRCSVHSTQIEADFAPTIGRQFAPSQVSSKENLPGSESFAGFHFLGCERVYDGKLQRRPPRRLVFGPDSPRPIGALLYAPQMPTIELSTLFSQLCLSLREKDTNHILLAPSLVRRISHASFLGVIFCKVQCICSKCFKPLKPAQVEKHKKRRTENTWNEPSFWHLPHPNESLDVWKDKNRPPIIPKPKIPKHIRNSPLKCPKGHSSASFEVRWECSGILDDGTGQAKLYAERDAALTLLGMCASTIQSIEEGIWSTTSGTIQFQKTVPPPEVLRAKVLHSFVQNRRYKRKNPLSLLEPSFRAEYLLHHHCRSSPQPRRPLEYFVRCKPLSDQIPHLHHTMVESSGLTRSVNGSREYALATQDVATYSLPPLKLVLVDCAISSGEDVFPP